MMNRREFMAAAGAAVLAPVVTRAEEKSAKNGFELKGKEFQGMAGVYSPIFTPYTQDNKINTEMLARMVEYQLAREQERHVELARSLHPELFGEADEDH